MKGGAAASVHEQIERDVTSHPVFIYMKASSQPALLVLLPPQLHALACWRLLVAPVPLAAGDILPPLPPQPGAPQGLICSFCSPPLYCLLPPF